MSIRTQFLIVWPRDKIGVIFNQLKIARIFKLREYPFIKIGFKIDYFCFTI